MKRLASLFLIGGAAALALRAHPVHAASFDCGQARSGIERIICDDATLSKLDESLDSAYERSLELLDVGAPGGDALTGDLRRAQTSWKVRRDQCATATCLRSAYETQLAILEFHGRPGASSWADKAAGTYQHEGFMRMLVQFRDRNSVRVVITGAEPSQGRWQCSFAGIGRLAAAGNVEVTSQGSNSGPALTMRPAAGFVDIPQTAVNQSANRDYCGLNGSLTWVYRTKP